MWYTTSFQVFLMSDTVIYTQFLEGDSEKSYSLLLMDSEPNLVLGNTRWCISYDMDCKRSIGLYLTYPESNLVADKTHSLIT